jgi:hypothetical protein
MPKTMDEIKELDAKEKLPYSIQRRRRKSKQPMLKNLRTGLRGEAFGLYFRVACLQNNIRHELQLYATKFMIDSGVLILYDAQERPYRAFAPGLWQEITSISIINGDEMWEDKDFVEEEDAARTH